MVCSKNDDNHFKLNISDHRADIFIYNRLLAHIQSVYQFCCTQSDIFTHSYNWSCQTKNKVCHEPLNDSCNQTQSYIANYIVIA